MAVKAMVVSAAGEMKRIDWHWFGFVFVPYLGNRIKRIRKLFEGLVSKHIDFIYLFENC
jgi:hypothetical protein